MSKCVWWFPICWNLRLGESPPVESFRIYRRCGGLKKFISFLWFCSVSELFTKRSLYLRGENSVLSVSAVGEFFFYKNASSENDVLVCEPQWPWWWRSHASSEFASQKWNCSPPLRKNNFGMETFWIRKRTEPSSKSEDRLVFRVLVECWVIESLSLLSMVMASSCLFVTYWFAHSSWQWCEMLAERDCAKCSTATESVQTTDFVTRFHLSCTVRQPPQLFAFFTAVSFLVCDHCSCFRDPFVLLRCMAAFRQQWFSPTDIAPSYVQ